MRRRRPDFGVVGTSLSMLTTKELRKWRLLVLLAFINAAFEALAAVSIFTLVALVSRTQPPPSNPALTFLKGLGPWKSGSSLVIAFSVVVAVFYCVKNGSQMAQVYLQQRLCNQIASRASTDIITGYLYMPYEAHFLRNTSEFIRNITFSTDAVFRSVLQAATVVASEGLMVGSLVLILFIKAPLVTSISVGLLAVLIGSFYYAFRPRFSRWGQLSQDLSAATLHTLQAGFGAVKEVTVLRRRRYFVERFRGQRESLARVFWNSSSMAELPRYVIEVIFVVLLATIIAFIAREKNAGGTIPVLGLYAYAGFRLMPSANRVVTQLNNIRYGAAAVEIVREQLDELGRVTPETETPEADVATFAGTLAIQDVSYSYPGAAVPAVTGLTCTISAGTSLAIVGASGSGKSTLLDLILGLLHPFQGVITLDGQPLDDCLEVWQRSIGYVAQSSFLVDDTIRRNTALAVPDDRIDTDRVWASLRAAQLADFIRSLPDQLDTRVGERGIRLSGGQRQRLAIARALYERPPVLVLDEATSALDSATESQVVSAIMADDRDRTLVVVAHRLSTVRNCDRLLYIESGQIVDEGSYSEVIGRNPSLVGSSQIQDEVTADSPATGPTDVRADPTRSAARDAIPTATPWPSREAE